MKKKLIIVLEFLFIVIITTTKVYAASYTVSVGKKNLEKGKSTTLTIKTNDMYGRFDITTSNASIVSLNSGKLFVKENDSASIELEGLYAGTATITVTPTDVASGIGDITLGSKSITITVSLPREKSTDNNLKSLSVEGYTITPEFNKDILDYKVSVPEGTEKINIVAIQNDKYAIVSSAGSQEVKDGVNTFNISVKAENGSEKIYNLVVDVIDENPINVTIDNKNYTVVKLRTNYICPELFTESEISIDNQTVPSCTNNKINYTLVGLKDESGNIDSFLYDNNKYTKYSEITNNSIKIIILNYDGELNNLVKDKITINDKDYEAYKYKKSNIYIVYGVNIESGEKDFYLYDSKNNTFSLFDMNYIDNLIKQNNIYLYVVIAFGFGLLLSIICVISVNHNKNKILKEKLKKKKGFPEVDENNDVEEKKNDIKEDNNEIVDEENTTYDIFQDDKKNNKRKKK